MSFLLRRTLHPSFDAAVQSSGKSPSLLSSPAPKIVVSNRKAAGPVFA
jgi:hypothetical protein